MKTPIIFLVFSFWSVLWPGHNALFAQRTCGTTDHLDRLQQADPLLKERRQEIESFIQEQIASGHVDAEQGVLTIPVVVHVIYENPEENISGAQIQSQIRILNEDFRRMNADRIHTPELFQPVAADIQIEFCLASINPNGAWTNGITRTPTSIATFGINDDMKFTDRGGRNAWPASDYLNIWVCDLDRFLGYAQFPGGPPATDGIVVDYQYFGDRGTATKPFDLGRTATHEVGHYLNLRHIWGDGPCFFDDLVGDTPLAGAPNGTRFPCTFPGPNSCITFTNEQPDMFQNYMDYTTDGCMNLFTKGQKDRMRAMFVPGGPRFSLLQSGACGPLEASCTDGLLNGQETGIDCGGPDCPPCSCYDGPLTLNIRLDDYPSETTWQITQADGTVVQRGGPYFGQTGQQITELLFLPDGDYTFSIFDVYGDGICCGFGLGSYALTDQVGDLLRDGGEFLSQESFSFCVRQTCPQRIDLHSGRLRAPLYEASDSLIVSIPTPANSDVALRAGHISLRPGFATGPSATFSAIANPCVPEEPSPARPPDRPSRSLTETAAAVANLPALTLTPNPTSDQVWVTWTGATGPYTLRVFSGTGQQIRRIEGETAVSGSARHRLDLSGQSAGMYWIVLEDASGMLRATVMKQNH